MTQYSGVYSLQTQGQAITSGQWATDPYYRNTTLLLHADGVASGSQNNTFLDSSTNNLPITRSGNTTQGSFTPYGPTWSNYFQGGSNYLSLASNAAFGVGTGDFTIECWIYPTSAWSAGSYNPIMYVSGTGLYFGQNASGFGLRQSGTADIIGYGTSPALNVWTHVAIVRSGTAVTMYYNGTSVATATSSANFSAGTVQMGYDGSYGIPASYISNFRLVKGTAVYTSAFTPSTTPLTAITNTSLLTCQSNRSIDNSSNAFAITVNGTPSVQRFSPFAPQYQYTPAVIGGSGYFDGSGDYLSTPDNTVFDLGSSDFTMECWIYPVASSSSAGQTIFGKRASAGTIGGVLLGFWGSTFYPSFYATLNGSTWGINNVTSSIACKPYAWNHVALTRNGSTWTIWVNGQSGNTASNAGTVYYNTSNFTVGATSADGSDVIFASYITDARIIKGAAVYTGAFTPPSLAPLASSGASSAASYPSTTNVNTSFSSSVTSLLCSVTNAGIYDNAMINDLETVGNAQVSANVVKYGSGSLAFDGTGDYLYINKSPSLTLGAGDFTVECWVYFTAVSGAQIIVDDYDAAATGWQLWMQNSFMKFYSGTSNLLVGTTALVTGTWYHVAVSRSGTAVTMFLNGVLEASGTSSASYTNATNPVLIGAQRASGPTSYLFGYLDDLRITKGVARYTANFQPPKVAFANQ